MVNGRDSIQRSILPIPDRTRVRLTTYDAKDPNTKFAPIEPLRPPKGAPNVLVVLLDDVGFGASSAFGGPVSMPMAERLAANGLKYTRFHTTALCSPTRACLLTGRNHHAVGMGFLTDIPIGLPGYTGRIPRSAGTLPRILRDAGYSTFAVGKWHLAPRWEQSASGPFDHWPLGIGFERYYGFLNGDTNQWTPELVRDNALAISGLLMTMPMSATSSETLPPLYSQALPVLEKVDGVVTSRP